MKTLTLLLTAHLMTHLVVLPSSAQPAPAHRALASHVIVPQTRAFVHDGVRMVQVDAVVEILEQVATTTLDLTLTNPGNARLEAELVVPVPIGVALRSVDFHGTSQEPSAELLAKAEAHRLYEAIVAKVRDPALVEFIGYNLVRSSVFPVEPHGWQKIRLVYEELLPAEGKRVDYILPKTESIDYQVPWRVTVKVNSEAPIATVYSPSHQIDVARSAPNRLTARIADRAITDPGSFRLSFLRQGDGMSGSLMAYPDADLNGGYFLLLAAPPAEVIQVKKVKREVILVIDRSGSMRGEKLAQAREAALQVLEGLDEGEVFNVIVYSDTVESFAQESVIKTPEVMRAVRAFVRSTEAGSGTNLHDALLEALGMKPREGFLPLVLFLTDGLPTVGQTSELAIRNLAIEANPHGRRVFTFGVGVDVNTPLLDRIASASRATATFVLPSEDVEVKVSQVFKRLSGPVLAMPRVEADDNGLAGVSPRVREVTPAKLPDLFEGDQLVLLGRYSGRDPIKFSLSGSYYGEERSFEFTFDLDSATSRNSFVPRLWASRKIATLTDAIRDLGADAPKVEDARVKELVDHIVTLSKEFGILTEYTAFLAQEGTDLAQLDQVLSQAVTNYQQRAINTRSGFASVNQDVNSGLQRMVSCVNLNNHFFDANMNRVSVRNVQQINDCAFYRRGQRWIDSRLIDAAPEPSRVVSVGSEEFQRLAARLATENRQGCVSLQGEILLQVDGETVLVK